MARLPNWMATFGNHGAARNAARAIDDHRTSALAVERQLASLPPSRVDGSAGPPPLGRPPLRSAEGAPEVIND